MIVYRELDQPMPEGDYVPVHTLIGYTYAATRQGATAYQGVIYNTPKEALVGLPDMLLDYPLVKGDTTSHTRVVKVYEA
jgi:hypothetical protein